MDRSAPRDHNIAELSIVGRSQRSAIEEVLANARETVAGLTGAIDEGKKVREDAHLAINQAFEALQQALELRKTTLLSELESISLSKTTALTLEKEKFEKIEVASSILLTHTDDEIAALQEFIATELSAMPRKVVPNMHSDTCVDVNTDGLIRELSKFGCISDLSLTPSSSTWTSTSVAKVKTDFHVKVESKTSKGTLYPNGGLQMKAEMRSNTGAVVHGEVEDHGDGTYTITLIPQTAGPHQLLITLNGQHVQNSPLDLFVLPVHDKYDCNNLGSCKQLIMCPEAPTSIATYYSGDLYIATTGGHIYLFDKNGYPKKIVGNRTLDNDFLFECSNNSRQCVRGFSNVIIKNDVLHFANVDTQTVHRLTLQGVSINQFHASGATGILVDEYNRIFVSDRKYNRINVFNHNGGNIFTIDGSVGNHSFKSPYGLAFDPLGNIHVAASDSNIIKVFTKEGVYIRKYGDLKDPRGIAIDGDGYSFVTEYEGNCISIFDPEGTKIHTVGGPPLHGPCGLALESTGRYLYVASYYSHVVLKYSICTKMY